MSENKLTQDIVDYAWLTLSCFCSALAVNFIFNYTGLAPGGITGMAIILNAVTHIPTSILNLCISIPLLILAFVALGLSFGFKTIFVIIFNSIALAIVPKINILKMNNYYVMLLMGSIIGGILVGLAVGIALNHGGATGGTDTIALLVSHFISKFETTNILFCIDSVVVILSGIVNKNIWVAIFSMISLLIINRVIVFFQTHHN